jgi:hypothetical protein
VGQYQVMSETLQLSPLPFPSQVPTAYRPLALQDEPIWDPARHLALTTPATTLGLAELGYGPPEVSAAASPLGVTAPFGVFSDEGLAAVRAVCLALQAEAVVGADERAPSYGPGAGYRSRFINDLCQDPRLVAHISDLAGIPLAPHSLPDCQAYVNYAPTDVTKAVDSWHVDSIAFDMVLMLSDPTRLRGGRLEFLRADRKRASELFDTSMDQLHLGYPMDPLADDVIGVEFPAAGFGVLQQGTHVVHRAARLSEPGERITLVLGYLPLEQAGPDPTNVEYISTWPHPGVPAELARHAAWLAGQRLADLTRGIDPDVSAVVAASQLRMAVADVERIARTLEAQNSG